MMPWALVFAADIAAGEMLEPREKKRRMNEMLGNSSGVFGYRVFVMCI
jgi:uncharacterized membrane protein